ncbi:hypothetical protein [Burkholderia sp. PU8-34]
MLRMLFSVVAAAGLRTVRRTACGHSSDEISRRPEAQLIDFLSINYHVQTALLFVVDTLPLYMYVFRC